MVARRTFLGWLSALPAGALGARTLIACGDTAVASPDGDASQDGDASPDTVTPDTVAPDTVTPDTVTPDTVDTFVPDAGPRTCAATTPDAQGPFYVAGAPPVVDLAGTAPGTPLSLSGEVTDTDCVPLANARVEVWQADADGDYHDDRLRATLTSDHAGAFAFTSIMPGRYLQASGFRPAHLHFRVSAPGFATLVTQIYFAGDPFLAPNDSCAPCGSDDPARILELADVDARKVAFLPIALRRTG